VEIQRPGDEADHFQIVLKLSSGDIFSTPPFVLMTRCLYRRVGKVVEKGVLSHVLSVGPSVRMKQRGLPAKE